MDPMDVVYQMNLTNKPSLSNNSPLVLHKTNMIASLVSVLHPRHRKTDLVSIGFNLASIPCASYAMHYAGYYDTGLRFPLSMFLLALLQALGVCYSQVIPVNMGRIMCF